MRRSRHVTAASPLAAVVAALVAVQLVASLSAVAVIGRRPAAIAAAPPSAASLPDAVAVQAAPTPSPRPSAALPAAAPAPAAVDPALPPPPVPPPAPEPAAAPQPAPAAQDDPAAEEPAAPPAARPRADDLQLAAAVAAWPGEALFQREHPQQAAAMSRPRQHPASHHWALLVGINRHQGRTRDNIGSAQDARALREVLLARGWRDDQILLLTDADATHDRIVRGLEWLIRATDERSVVVFSYSGHTRQSKSDADGDGERVDEGVWASDNRYLWDADLGRMLGAVRAERMWITIQACEAAGFNDPGVERPGRVMTYSSREDQKSYEDPAAGFSVQGHYLVVEGFAKGFGDIDGDGRTGVQEVWRWAEPRTTRRTAGLQQPIIVDGLGRPFLLEVGAP